ncbi:MAG: sigma-70 family RNA polymerase sigma factor [Lewinellaceae bacterium]|nr:sigma-70 family RNA polymerase sigma factor [Lewinellaceae bacterium]
MEKTNQPEWTDEAILEALQRGGTYADKAWEYMSKKWRGILIESIKKRGKQVFVKEAELEEGIVEASISFIKTVTNPKWPGLKNKLSTYFAACVYNAWVKIRKRDKPYIFPGEEPPVPEDDTPDVYEEERDMLNQALQYLDAKCRELLRMDYEGYSNQEIADASGLSRRAITKRLTRCRNRLRDLIRKLFNL